MAAVATGATGKMQCVDEWAEAGPPLGATESSTTSPLFVCRRVADVVDCAVVVVVGAGVEVGAGVDRVLVTSLPRDSTLTACGGGPVAGKETDASPPASAVATRSVLFRNETKLALFSFC